MSAQRRKSNASGPRRRTIGSRRRPVFPLAFLLLILILFPGETPAFQIPEVLNYDLTWTGIKAGEASLAVREDGDGIRIISTARSAKWVSVFYVVDDRVESSVVKNGAAPVIGPPLHYLLRLREGRHRKNKEVIFDVKKAKAVYIDHLDKEKKEFTVPAVVFDPLSSFYYLRTLKLEVGKPVYVTVFDSKKVWNVEVQVLRKERVEVPAGRFDTILVRPMMKSEGFFSRRGEIYIWLTDDDRKIPVLLKTKVKIGSVNASLTGGSY